MFRMLFLTRENRVVLTNLKRNPSNSSTQSMQIWMSIITTRSGWLWSMLRVELRVGRQRTENDTRFLGEILFVPTKIGLAYYSVWNFHPFVRPVAQRKLRLTAYILHTYCIFQIHAFRQVRLSMNLTYFSRPHASIMYRVIKLDIRDNCLYFYMRIVSFYHPRSYWVMSSLLWLESSVCTPKSYGLLWLIYEQRNEPARQRSQYKGSGSTTFNHTWLWHWVY